MPEARPTMFSPTRTTGSRNASISRSTKVKYPDTLMQLKKSSGVNSVRTRTAFGRISQVSAIPARNSGKATAMNASAIRMLSESLPFLGVMWTVSGCSGDSGSQFDDSFSQ